MEKSVNCSICLSDFLESECIKINQCFHLFCKTCFVTYIKSCLENKIKIPIQCPYLEHETQILIEPKLILNTLSSKDKEKYLFLSIQNYFDTFPDRLSWCPSPNCQYGFEIVNGCNKFECPKCLKIYCLLCRSKYHKGKTCREFQEENKNDVEEDFFKFVKSIKMKKCPKCQTWIEKTEGCNHMICACKHEFCYLCGESITKGIHSNCSLIYDNNSIDFDSDNDYFKFDNYIKELNKKNYSNKGKNKLYINYDSSLILPRKSDGTLDMRYSKNKEIVKELGIDINLPLTKTGKLDMRYKINKECVETSFELGIKGPKKNDGTLDMRYKVNKEIFEKPQKIGKTKKDGTLDRRYKANK